MNAPGLTTIAAQSSPQTAIAKLESEIAARGLTIFARIDHAAGAAAAGLSLRPTFLLLFGNAKGGTPLMQQSQSIGIDLPLKFLIWQDEAGTTQISYNRPAWLAERHGVQAPPVIDAMENLLAALAKSV